MSDVFSESTPSTRVVGAYGIHHRRPLAHWAAVTITNRELWVESGADGNGRDQDNSGDVYAANESLAYLEFVAGTVFEVN